MKKIILLISIIAISNCTLKEINKNHGVAKLEEKYNLLIKDKTNKNDILDELGPPSTRNIFKNDIWIYIEKKTTKSNIFKFASKKDLKNNILVLEINNRGLLVSKKLYTIDDLNRINISEKKTKVTEKDSFVYGVISSLKQKIDSPKTNKKVTQQ